MVFIAKGSDDQNIWVVSNCEQIWMYQDDILIGKKDTKGENLPSVPVCFEMDGTYQTLRAEGIRNGEKVAEYTWQRAGAPCRIEVTYDDASRPLQADGIDKLMVYARIVDKNGVVCTTADHSIQFSVDGPAKIVGDGVARVGANPIQAQAGIAAILLEADTQAAMVTVTAHSDGLEAGVAQIPILPAAIEEIPYYIPENRTGARVVFPDEQEQSETESDRGSLKNIAKGKPANASSSNPLCGNDGRYDTEWIANPTDQNPNWTVDLEKEYALNSIRILWSKDGTTYTYNVLGKTESGEWTLLLSKSGTGQNIAPIPLNGAVARYVRIEITDVSKGTAAFAEVEIFPENVINNC